MDEIINVLDNPNLNDSQVEIIEQMDYNKVKDTNLPYIHNVNNSHIKSSILNYNLSNQKSNCFKPKRNSSQDYRENSFKSKCSEDHINFISVSHKNLDLRKIIERERLEEINKFNMLENIIKRNSIQNSFEEKREILFDSNPLLENSYNLIKNRNKLIIRNKKLSLKNDINTSLNISYLKTKLKPTNIYDFNNKLKLMLLEKDYEMQMKFVNENKNLNQKNNKNSKDNLLSILDENNDSQNLSKKESYFVNKSINLQNSNIKSEKKIKLKNSYDNSNSYLIDDSSYDLENNINYNIYKNISRKKSQNSKDLSKNDNNNNSLNFSKINKEKNSKIINVKSINNLSKSKSKENIKNKNLSQKINDIHNYPIKNNQLKQNLLNSNKKNKNQGILCVSKNSENSSIINTREINQLKNITNTESENFNADLNDYSNSFHIKDKNNINVELNQENTLNNFAIENSFFENNNIINDSNKDGDDSFNKDDLSEELLDSVHEHLDEDKIQKLDESGILKPNKYENVFLKGMKSLKDKKDIEENINKDKYVFDLKDFDHKKKTNGEVEKIKLGIRDILKNKFDFGNDYLNDIHKRLERKATDLDPKYESIKNGYSKYKQQKILAQKDHTMAMNLHTLNRNPIFQINNMITFPVMINDPMLLASIYSVNMFNLEYTASKIK